MNINSKRKEFGRYPLKQAPQISLSIYVVGRHFLFYLKAYMLSLYLHYILPGSMKQKKKHTRYEYFSPFLSLFNVVKYSNMLYYLKKNPKKSDQIIYGCIEYIYLNILSIVIYFPLALLIDIFSQIPEICDFT